MLMDGRVKEINRLVSGYDKYLYARRDRGVIHIYRKIPGNSAAPHHRVCSLTDDWTIKGNPREWGLEVISARLRAMDLWKDETVVDRIEKDLKGAEQTEERELKNNVESFLKDFRRQFAKATNGINTSSLDRFDRRALKGA